MSEYPRNQSGFAAAYDAAQFHVSFHNKPIWVYVSDTAYVTSVVKPNPKNIAPGCIATQYGNNMTEIATMKASRDA